MSADDRGSVTTELVLVTPLLVLLLVLVGFVGRSTRAQSEVREAAAQAARAASFRQAPSGAVADATAAAERNLSTGRHSCSSWRVAVDTSGLRPGGQVAVTVQCDADLSDLGLLGVPGRRTFSARSVQVVDRRRGG